MQRLLDLAQRVGNDPLLTQGSTGNISVKKDGVLWIKASGKWMADATREDMLVPLGLDDVKECLQRRVDPSLTYPSASLETALHATLPHRVVLHVHCVNTIAWAVRKDAPLQLRNILEGLVWRWVPYLPSGLPLAEAVEYSLDSFPSPDVFVLGNHGLVIAGKDGASVEDLLSEVRRRVAIHPRPPLRADYTALWEICQDARWELPDDDSLHSLGTDPISQAILEGGLLYPCQAIFAGSEAELYRPISYNDLEEDSRRYCNRRFLVIQDRGVVVSRSISRAELAMLGGLAQVVRRLSPHAPLRYLTEDEISGIPAEASFRYRELANYRPDWQSTTSG
ncbi:MAG TPA: class II aldolase/adducin family protein [Bryobacteraceae bacterium]